MSSGVKIVIGVLVVALIYQANKSGLLPGFTRSANTVSNNLFPTPPLK